MKYLVAVSGGVDSVVLLDILARAGEHELIVAHFDHGIRDDSAADARFVDALAKKYDLPFVMKREELGATASEETARARRYAFLHEEAEKHGATIVTAHHGDDVIETIAINLIRGTGWRGAAVLASAKIGRPLLRFSKSEIRDYALTHRLEWVEDSTNETTLYLRNRVRQAIAANMPGDVKQEVLTLWKKQVKLRDEIDELLAGYVHESGEYARYFFIQADASAAQEILRTVIFAAAHTGPTRPQLERALLAIKTAHAGAVHHVMRGAHLRFSKVSFVVETP